MWKILTFCSTLSFHQVFSPWIILRLWISISFEEFRYQHAFKSSEDVIVETACNIFYKSRNWRYDFLPYPLTKVLNNHVHEEKLKSNTHVTLLIHLLPKYWEKIWRHTMLNKDYYRTIIEIHDKLVKFLDEDCLFFPLMLQESNHKNRKKLDNSGLESIWENS